MQTVHLVVQFSSLLVGQLARALAQRGFDVRRRQTIGALLELVSRAEAETPRNAGGSTEGREVQPARSVAAHYHGETVVDAEWVEPLNPKLFIFAAHLRQDRGGVSRRFLFEN